MNTHPSLNFVPTGPKLCRQFFYADKVIFHVLWLTPHHVWSHSWSLLYPAFDQWPQKSTRRLSKIETKVAKGAALFSNYFSLFCRVLAIVISEISFEKVGPCKESILRSIKEHRGEKVLVFLPVLHKNAAMIIRYAGQVPSRVPVFMSLAKVIFMIVCVHTLISCWSFSLAIAMNCTRSSTDLFGLCWPTETEALSLWIVGLLPPIARFQLFLCVHRETPTERDDGRWLRWSRFPLRHFFFKKSNTLKCTIVNWFSVGPFNHAHYYCILC